MAMIVANFTGAEAEELRRAVGMRRFWERMKNLEGKLRAGWMREEKDVRPLRQMNTQERLVADYSGTGLTVGKHPMHYYRAELIQKGVLSAQELKNHADGTFVKAAGCVIARQRPGTAKGFIFLSMEDETGIANVIVTPSLYERQRVLVTRSKFLLVEGKLQNQDGVIHVKAATLSSFSHGALEMSSRDFH
jgi:error-prone DNA polymerase